MMSLVNWGGLGDGWTFRMWCAYDSSPDVGYLVLITELRKNVHSPPDKSLRVLSKWYFLPLLVWITFFEVPINTAFLISFLTHEGNFLICSFVKFDSAGICSFSASFLTILDLFLNSFDLSLICWVNNFLWLFFYTFWL